MSGRTAMLQIPPAIRAAVDERDGKHCRVCGIFAGDGRQQHHIHYGGDYAGMGGRRLHEVENIVTLCMACHHLVHSAKWVWLPWLELVVTRPGTTVLALQRRARRARVASPAP